MSARLVIIVAVATLSAGLIWHHQSRPFSVVEWTADWDGGPDINTREYRASIAVGERLALHRQEAAPYQAAGAFFVIVAIGMMWICFKTRLFRRIRSLPN